LLLTKCGEPGEGARIARHRWLRRYRFRAHGEDAGAVDELKKGARSMASNTVRSRRRGARPGANCLAGFAIREARTANEVRNVMAHLGLEVNRMDTVVLTVVSIGELANSEGESRGDQDPGAARSARRKSRTALAGADFKPSDAWAMYRLRRRRRDRAQRGKKPFKPGARAACIADRKRAERCWLQRTGQRRSQRQQRGRKSSGYGPRGGRSAAITASSDLNAAGDE